VENFIGDHFMKKSLQLTLILSALLFTFSCDGGDPVDTSDPGTTLTSTWQVASITAYDDVACSETSLFDYMGSAGVINAPLAADCQHLAWFTQKTAGGDATFAENGTEFCDGTDNLNVSIYFQMTASDTLDTEAAGNYTHTMYATAENGMNHTKEYSTYGRYFTYGTNMTTEILAKVANDIGQENRVVSANPDDEIDWTYNSSAGLTMTWVDPASAGDADGGASCVVITYEAAATYDLRGCTDEIAENYFGGDNNDYGLTATQETGMCVYTVDEASQGCVKMSHDDVNGDGSYTDDEVLTYPGIIDCVGACNFEAASGWVGDGECDDGNRGHGTYNCEAFNWDGWDCTCNTGCVSTYPAGDDGTFSVDMGTTASELSDGTCQDGCNVEDCGYDIDVLATGTWDCCSETCLTFLAAAPGACPTDEACNTGGCNFFRAAGTADIGVCCDQTGPDGAVGGDDDIDCSTFDAVTNPDGLGDNGTCDEACNSGACNNDGGDCE